MPGSESAYDCPQCDRSNSADNMVQCDSCEYWFHYSCVGVNQSIANEDRSFHCQECKKEDSVGKSDFKSISTGSHVNNHGTAEQLELLEELKAIRLRKIDAEQERLRKLVEQEEAFKLQRLEEEEKYINKKMELLAMGRTMNVTKGSASVISETLHQKEVQKWVKNQQQQVVTLRTGPGRTNPNDLPIGDEDCRSVRTVSTQCTSQYSQSLLQPSRFNFPTDVPTSSKRIGNPQCNPMNLNREPREEPYHRFSGPSKEQIAARHVMKDELPSFSGNPEEWPLFISNFTLTTNACGYTDVENMVRLQRSLKGPAMEAVRSRLLIPSSVPSVIETLKKLFGRPEIVINVLLAKIRATPTPKPDKLETLICYGMAVNNFCDHLIAAEQRAHLSNPCRLQELVDKLPANLKLEWACHKRNLQSVDLESFGNFMSAIVEAAADVTLITEPYTGKFAGKEKEKAKQEKLFVHAAEESGEGNEPCGESDQPRNPKNQLKTRSVECFCCNEPNHRIVNCEAFRKMTVENRWKLVHQNGLCRTCLNKHGRWPCKNWRGCEIAECRYKHHTLLHSAPNNSAIEVEPSLIALHMTMPTILFRIIPVRLYGKSCEINTYAFLDDGSSSTLIDDELATQLGIEGEIEPLCLRWTSDVTRIESNSRKVQLAISGVSSNKRYTLTGVRTVGNPELPSQSLDYQRLSGYFPHLRGLPMESYHTVKPRILIGVDNLRVHSPLKRREGKFDEPVAVKTRLGWTIYGRTSATEFEDDTKTSCFHVCECSRNHDDEELHHMVKVQLTLEDSWVTEQPISEDEKRALNILERTTKRTEFGYETGLIWKQDHVEFPDGYEMALKRLRCLEKRFEKDPEVALQVERQMEDYQRKGYIHRATPDELESFDPRRVWFLPLGVVKHPKKSKIRLVWDAAAQVDGMSFNSQLLKGPDFLVPLPTVLLRFRQRKIAVSGDIREMFLQLKMCLVDKQSQLFLYRKDPSQPPEVYVIDVVTFGAACSPSTAQFIKIRNAEEFASQYPRAVEAILKSHYVDDLLDSVDTEEEAIQLIKDVRAIHKAAGFEIRNFVSNSTTVMEAVREDPERCSANRSMKLDGTEVSELVLGMLWKPQSDEFSFSTRMNPEIQQLMETDVIPTKRQVLRAVMSVFDPLGLIAFFTVQGKMLIQEIWRTGTAWDECISSELVTAWQKWSRALHQLGNVTVPRCLFPGKLSNPVRSVELHTVVDASKSAYACAVYVRYVINNEIKCSLVTAKSKVAPLKPLSIPRLELQAALIGARLAKNVGETLTIPVTRRRFWSDSMTVLAWLKSDSRRYHQFVGVRVGEILTLTDVSEWMYVPSESNVADDATKWSCESSFEADSRWYNGPKFLREPENEWSQIVPDPTTTEDTLKIVHLHHQEKEPLIRFERFSNWDRLLRAVAYMYLFIRKCRKNAVDTKPTLLLIGQQEFERAENYLWQVAQRQAYPNEYSLLERYGSDLDAYRRKLSRCSPLYNLAVFLDNHGVMRIRGRIGAAPQIPYEAKYPILLPRDHPVTLLLIDRYHRRFLHCNRETVVNELRQYYWIPRLRATVQRVCKNCQFCRVYKAKAQPPAMGPLPKVRLTPFIRPFTFTGLDYFGPVNVKVGRSLVKRWVALFTCLTIRAVHLEVVHSLTTSSCIKAIRRFVVRRGAPEEIYSDNGTCFVGANRQLVEQLKAIHEGCANVFTSARTKWLFNPPSAPHMGGVWERMVRSVKTAMEAVAGAPRHPDDETLETILLEAEGIVNSRPLTYVPLETAADEALTPNHFLLYGNRGVTQPTFDFVSPCQTLRDSWKLTQHLADEFWRRWIKEYLPVLRRQVKWFEPAKPIDVGDLVIVIEESARNHWERGVVTEVYPGSDGHVRTAMVQTTTGTKKRPVAKLALLDVRKIDSDGEMPSSQLHGVGYVAKAPRPGNE